MDGNGHVVAATWRAEDFTELAALNEPVWVDIFEGKRPPVCIDPRGYEQFVYLGDLGNPLIAEAVVAHQVQQRAMQKEPDRPWVDVAMEVRAVNDKVLAAILQTPPYCPKERLVNGRPPPGYLWWGSFTQTQRQLLVDFWHSGLEALKSVRAATPPDEHAVHPGVGLPPVAESPADPPRPAVDSVVPERGGTPLANGTGGRGTGQPVFDLRAE